MNAKDYLAQGSQTQFTDRVREHTTRAQSTVMKNPVIAGLPDPLLSIHKTCKYISTLPLIAGYVPRATAPIVVDGNERLKRSIFCKRNLDGVLRDGAYPTCSDYGLLFRGLMAAQGHPTAFVETFHEDFLLGRAFHTHVFGRVFYEGGSLLVNPLPNPVIVGTERELLPYVIFREGLDASDIGITSYDDLFRMREEHLGPLLDHYEHLRASVHEEEQRK
ncbi:TPA: hypothetical protein HA251_06125 [Candidatus Woesearchaeota archaeon]|nr:hypothetical protein [Candidatus Woesearchaeota archaeon]